MDRTERYLVFYHYALALLLGRSGDGVAAEASRAFEDFDLKDDWGSCTFTAIMISRMGVPADWRDLFVRAILSAICRFDDDNLHRACGLALLKLDARDELEAHYRTAETGSQDLECLGAVLDHMRISRPTRGDDETAAA